MAIEKDSSHAVEKTPISCKANEDFSTLYAITLDILSSHDIDDIIKKIVFQAGVFLQAEHSFLYMTTTPEELELKAGIGVFSTLVGTNLEIGQDFAGQIWQIDRPFYIEEYSNWQLRIFQHSVKTMIGVPLKAHDNIIAVLGLGFDENIIELAQQKLLWLGRFADVVAIALDNARLYSSTVDMTKDVTTWVLAQEEINQLSFAVDQSPGATIFFDIEGKITYVNAKFVQVTGYSSGEIIGQNIKILRSTIYSEGFYKQIWDTIKAGKEWRGEFYNKKRDGTMYWALASISPVKNLEGNVVYYLQIQQDITKQKKIEQTLQQQNIEIQETLSKLKHTQDHLIQQEKLAGIGQLAAGVAHEINNPLGFIWSNIDVLRKYTGKIVEMVREFKKLHKQVLEDKTSSLYTKAEEIAVLAKQKKLDYTIEDLEPVFIETNEGLNRISNIVKALRIFSRVDGQGGFEEYDLNEGLKNSLIIARNEVKYVAEVKTNFGIIPQCKAMASQINQVLLNIIINAAHAIKSKDIDTLGLITVSTYADDTFIYCKIEDSGMGIPDRIKKYIFNPFFTTKPVGQGTGLGLSISYDIVVNKHRGELLCESELGKGSMFIVKIPIDGRKNEEVT